MRREGLVVVVVVVVLGSAASKTRVVGVRDPYNEVSPQPQTQHPTAEKSQKIKGDKTYDSSPAASARRLYPNSLASSRNLPTIRLRSL